MCDMASRATGGTFAAFLISGAILGFAGGAFIGTQADGGGDGGTPDSSTTAPPEDGTAAGDADGATDGASPDAGETPAGDGALTISAGKGEVKADERIDLSGSIDPPEEGVKLQLQRSVDGGEFEDFPIDAWETNANGEFSGYVQSSRKGENAFRVVLVDDTAVASEAAVVTIS